MSAFLKFVTEEWYFSGPMFAVLFAATVLVIWRIFLNINAQTNLNEFLPAFQDRLEKEGAEGALRFCKAQSGMIPRRLYVAGLDTSKQGLAAMRRAMAGVIELEILPDLNFLLAPILAIAKIATMLGLLLTVISMINTFNKISSATSAAGVTGQAGAIGLALFGTMMGLVIAIPLVFAHVMFKDWVNKFEIKMKSAAQRLLIVMQSARPATSQPATAKPAAAAQPSTAVSARQG
jgi:biopolymer transport protein ExbB